MNDRVKIVDLDADADPPWEGIRPPWQRLRNHHSYVRDELAHVVRRKFVGASAVSCRCPVDDEDGPHSLTITLRGENVAFRCEEGHASDEIIEAIIEQLEE